MRKLARPYDDPTPLFRHGDVRPLQSRRWLDFSVNFNPIGPPGTTLAALQKVWPWFPDIPPSLRHLVRNYSFFLKRQKEARAAFRRSAIAHYPDAECRQLVDRLAASHGIEPDQIVAGNGSTELIYVIPRALRPRRVAIAEPTFTEYLRASLQAGATVDHWLADDPDFTPRPFDTSGADLVWLCNPNNPTGRLWFREPLLQWIEAQPRTLFVVDEAFLPFQADEAEFSLVPEAGRRDNLIVLRSMTKFYNLAGLRLGYAVAHPTLARQLRELILPWSVNAMAQIAGAAALDDPDIRATTHAWLADEQAVFRTRLQGVAPGLQPLAGAANFVLVRLRGVTAPCLARRLEQTGILIRDASNFVGLNEQYVRIAVRRPRANQRLLDGLRSLFQDL